MSKTARRGAHAAVLAAFLGWTANATATESSASVVDAPSLMSPDARVRGVSARVVAVINEAAARSESFRGLVAQIGTTDGIVYVAEGQCGHGVRACLLLTMTTMGENRVLRILVDPRKSDPDLMGSIGHELQHAMEVLSHRSVRSYSAMILLFKKACGGCDRRFETDAAIATGVAVRRELLESVGP
jgi:hypothetical protein